MKSPRLRLYGACISCLGDGCLFYLSSLLVLSWLMVGVGVKLAAEVASRPWPHLDLTCGTRFGGTFALVLGKLRMVGLLISIVLLVGISHTFTRF